MAVLESVWFRHRVTERSADAWQIQGWPKGELLVGPGGGVPQHSLPRLNDWLNLRRDVC